MKKIIFVISTLFIFSLSYSQDMASASDAGSASLNKARITFADDAYDFGTIKTNVPVSHTFILKNTGSVPLIINRVSTTCGCTASEYPKEAILPDKSADITITFNASAKGAFNKSATVYSNASNETVVLNIKGIVN
jgi:hypothetical protein